MSTFCGLDFGTSNSTIGVQQNGISQLVLLENDKPTIRSAIFCDGELKQWVFGQAGINRYLEHAPGRLLMSLKSVLGSSLMDDKTLIFNDYISYTAILGHFIKSLKAKAEDAAQHELTQVVLGRPVRFHDHDDEKDHIAQNTLEKIAHEVGFKDVAFQYEPIAAALAYETSIQSEQIALIVDMGGGTSDFTIIRLRPGQNAYDRSEDVLANTGIHIAGTDFDQSLSIRTIMPLLGMHTLMRGSSSDIEVPASYYFDLATWHAIAQLYQPKTLMHLRSIQSSAYRKDLIGRLIHVIQTRAGHKILNEVESAKQQLSDQDEVQLNLECIEDDLAITIQQAIFNQSIEDYLKQIVDTILKAVTIANIKPQDINAIFYTGGSTKIPLIHDMINPHFPNAAIVKGDAFGSVGMGLTIDAERKFRG